MIKFREYEDQDKEELERINEQQPHRYNLDQPTFLRGVAYDDTTGNIIGFGDIEIIYAANIILDYEASKRDRVSAVLELFKHGMIRSDEKGIKFWYVFCEDKFAALLEKQFGFRKVDGKSLVLEL